MWEVSFAGEETEEEGKNATYISNLTSSIRTNQKRKVHTSLMVPCSLVSKAKAKPETWPVPSCRSASNV